MTDFWPTAFLLLGLLSAAHASAQGKEHCFVPPNNDVRLEREPSDLFDLGITIGIAYEGFLYIDGRVVPSPTGDITIAAGPYDPTSGRLYIWGYDENGWVDLRTLEQGGVRPILYSPASDIEDATYIKRSEVLGVQFYSGWTAPHWFSRQQSYRVYALSGTDMTRVKALEREQLRFVGDDIEAKLAVFAPVEERSTLGFETWVWFDGTQILPHSEHLKPIKRCSRDK